MGKSTVLLEQQVGQDSVYAGRPQGEAPLPRGAVVISVQRNGQTIFPRGDTLIEPDDLLSGSPAPTRSVAQTGHSAVVRT